MRTTTIALMTLLLWLVPGARPVTADPGDLLQVFASPVAEDIYTWWWPVATGRDRIFLGDGHGSVHMFDKTTGDLLHSYASSGLSIAATDQHLFMTGSADDGNGGQVGAVLKYDYDGNLLQTFSALRPSIAVHGNKLAAGNGSVQILDSTTGELLLTLEHPTGESNPSFGCSKAFVGDNLLVGQWGADYAGVELAGAAYLFDGTTGALLHTFVDPNPRDHGYFGWSVASLGSKVVIGAPTKNMAVFQYAGPGIVY